MVEGRQVTPPEPVTAIVVDEAGQPLRGVAVNAFMGDAAVTGADGRFELKTPWPTMRLVVDGYVPATRLTATVRTSGRVVLVAARARPTVLPRCGPQHSIKPGIGDLRVPTFPKARRSQGEDIDYQTESWIYKGTELLHGWGTMWSGGLPSPETLATLRSIEERDVRTPTAGGDDPFVGLIADVRGVQPDGRRFRFVGEMLETFHYRDASPEVAAYFDRMLDAMCYLEPVFSGPKP